jgi:hypothetical protein
MAMSCAGLFAREVVWNGAKQLGGWVERSCRSVYASSYMHYGDATRAKMVCEVDVDMVNRGKAGRGRDAVVDVVRGQLGAVVPREY